jgi:hypothetical protein
MRTDFLAVISTADGARLDAIAATAARAGACGEIDEDTASAVLDAVQARRIELRGVRHPRARAHARPARERRPSPRSPDRAASIARRRSWSASGWMPPHLAAHFTAGQAACLAVLASEIAERGVCTWPIDRLAAIAGVSRTVAKEGIRVARALGLLDVVERRRPGLPSLTNIVRISSAEWATWLRLRGRGRKSDRFNQSDIYSLASNPTGRAKRSLCNQTTGEVATAERRARRGRPIDGVEAYPAPPASKCLQFTL